MVYLFRLNKRDKWLDHFAKATWLSAKTLHKSSCSSSVFHTHLSLYALPFIQNNRIDATLRLASCPRWRNGAAIRANERHNDEVNCGFCAHNPNKIQTVTPLDLSICLHIFSTLTHSQKFTSRLERSSWKYLLRTLHASYFIVERNETNEHSHTCTTFFKLFIWKLISFNGVFFRCLFYVLVSRRSENDDTFSLRTSRKISGSARRLTWITQHEFKVCSQWAHTPKHCAFAERL